MRECLVILLIVGLAVVGVDVTTQTFDVDAQGRPMSSYREHSHLTPDDELDEFIPDGWPRETSRDAEDSQFVAPFPDDEQQTPSSSTQRGRIPAGA